MIAFQLNDVNDTPLREAGVQLKIANAATIPKADLIAAIKEKVSPDQALILSPPLTPSTTKWWKAPATLIALLALIVSGLSAGINYWGASNTLNKYYVDYEKQKKIEWQTVKVYDIIAKNTFSHERWAGMTFEDIRTHYSTEIAASTSVNLGKDDLQPESLQLILTDLIKFQLVQRTLEDKYVIVRVGRGSRDCFTRPTTETVQREVLVVLRTESGKYGVAELAEKVKDATKLSSEDVYATLNCMVASGTVRIESDKKVYPAVSPAVPKAMEPAPSFIMPDPKTVPPQAPPIKP